MMKVSKGALAACVVLSLTASLRADLLSHWPLDGDFADQGPGENDGVFFGEEFPFFEEGFDGSEEGALRLDGIDDWVEVLHVSGLPASQNTAYSIAMWVKALPQQDRRVYSEGSGTDNTPLFTIGTHFQALDGRVDIFLRTAAGAAPHNHTLSNGIAFDGTWHHIAWVDDNGDAALYIDGARDATDFSYAKPALPVDFTSLGAVVRPSRVPPECCFIEGAIDDVRIYDHALSEEEVRALLPLEECPVDGDTHCTGIDIIPPPGGEGETGTYTVLADAVDDSGDEIRYFFQAESDGGRILTAGPTTQESADFDLEEGVWTISVTVDDDSLCMDQAPDAVCTAAPIAVECPAMGDTHCADLQVAGPIGDGPGLYTVSVLGATDDSGDPITYRFTATDAQGGSLPPQTNTTGFADFDVVRQGTWTFAVTVDDDPDCDDQADDAVCTLALEVGCPPEGDTHCDDLVVEGPDGTPGTYTVTAGDATDDSGDFVTYLFRAESDDGTVLEFGPQDTNVALMTLGEGNWTITVTVDDDPLCDDQADDAVCTDSLEITAGPPRLLSHWAFDGDVLDSAGVNDGVFFGGLEIDPLFVEGFDGNPEGAILFDGIDDYVDVFQDESLPLYAHRAFTIAMWVNGGPQGDDRVWSEGSTLSNAPLFNLGTEAGGTEGTLDFFLRGGPGVGTVVNHRQSDQLVFDESWHHIAWVDDNGKAILYVDGIRDATDFTYERPPMGLDTTTIGGILRAAPCCWFTGGIDDVRVYNYALDEDEVIALVPEPADCSRSGDTHCSNLVVEPPPEGFEGVHRVSVDAADDTGDAVVYIFTAVNEEGLHLQQGPQAEPFADFNLFAGTWTIRVTADDDLLCRASAPDAVCTSELTVEREPPVLLTHLRFDGDTTDSGVGGNDGDFIGAPQPTFVDDPDGNPGSALSFDGADDYVVLQRNQRLPVYNHRAFTIAMWVKGGPQGDNRVWSEGSTLANAPLFNLGTEVGGTAGTLDFFLRGGAGVGTVVNHRQSDQVVFDDTWHHIAWVDDGGNAVLYVDGIRDATDFTYRRPPLDLDTTTVGGILRAAPCCWFEGSIDDVRVYNYALTEREVNEIIDPGGGGTPFHRGDANDDGAMNITDPIFILSFLFLGNAEPTCREAADLNDDGGINITDAVVILTFLFQGGNPPAPPGPVDEPCGPDPEGSPDLGCESYTNCE